MRRRDRARVCLAAALFCCLFCTGSARAAEIVGVIRGRDGRPLRDAVVFVRGLRSGVPVRRTATMDQRNRTFIPHVMVVPLGTTVLFPNHDHVFHNVFSFREGKRFDLGLYRVGETKRENFNQPGLVRLFCNIHSNMSAYIWVVENPYFAKTEEDGVYRLRDVPPGEYSVEFWHPKAGMVTRQIRVTGGEVHHDEVLGG